MEDYIYVLLGILWVAYSLYSARQKAIRKQQSAGLPPRGPSQSSPLPIPGNQGDGRSVLEDLFRELSGEARPEVQESKPVDYSAPVSYKEVTELNQPIKGFSNYKLVSSDNPRAEKQDTQDFHGTFEGQGQKAKNEGAKINFNLREAVIFSELLNRKYF